MNIKLYPCFDHWKKFNNIWLYSDPHFSDNEMKYLRKNYIGDEEQVKRINAKVGKKDLIIFLGDIGDLEWVSKVRGYKVLIMGNHDAGASHYKRETILCNADDEGAHRALSGNWVKDNRLFDEVYEGALIISEKLILSHEPIDFPYAFNIHGHSHGAPLHIDKKHWNVCAELINYTPVSLKSIVESGMLSNVITIHRETIDEATKRKAIRNGK